MRLLFRLGILGLAGFGAKTLYEKYSPRAAELGTRADQAKTVAGNFATKVGHTARGASHDFADRASEMEDHVETAADQLGDVVRST